MTRVLPFFAALFALTVGSNAHAQPAVDVGVIKDDDIKIVQKLLYPKADRLETGAHLAVMPFDAFTFTPGAHTPSAENAAKCTVYEKTNIGSGRNLPNTPTLGRSPRPGRF